MPSANDPVNITRASADLLGRVIKDSRGRGRGEVPLAKRRRPIGGSGGGGHSTLSASFAVVTSFIGPATGDTGTIVPGGGQVQAYDIAGDGTRTPSIENPDPFDVYNYDPSDSYDVGTGVYLVNGGASRLEVMSAFCATFAEPEE